MQIAPSILAADLSKLSEEITAVDKAGADVLHFDVMDGHFVPNITFGLPLLESARKCSSLPFDAHLMISHPDPFLKEFKQVGCDWISVHVEACPHLNRTLNAIKELEMKAGVAINPGTSLASLDAVLDVADYVLIMSVNPGFGGQSFIASSLERVKTIKQKAPSLLVQIDGGIKLHNIAAVREAGVDVAVVGTGIFNTSDYTKTIDELKKD